MTALGKLFKTTAFRLTLIYVVMVAIGGAVVLLAVSWNVGRLIDEQIAETVEAEITGLSEQYAQGRLVRLVDVIERRSRDPGASLYLLTSASGKPLTGNIAVLPAGILDHPGIVETPYQRAGESQANHVALARIFILPGGFRLLVGRDLEEREALRQILSRVFMISLLALTAMGTLGGLFVARRVLRRVDEMSESAASIMEGDLSLRLRLAGTGDELDRLAQNLNFMLDRIGELMQNLREVTDNIAHDLKTPLTRLRNGAEQALRSDRSPEQQHQALERIISEADGLIGIFNGLLMIARAQARAGRETMHALDLAALVQDVGELYEPVAEEANIQLKIDAPESLYVRGIRELLSQTLANLIENALKYGKPQSGPGTIALYLRHEQNMAQLVVADAGSGIAPADRARVLQRFVRLETSRSQSGSGLGLALANAVVQLHDGTMTLADNNPGLRVVICLPIGVELSATSPASAPGATTS